MRPVVRDGHLILAPIRTMPQYWLMKSEPDEVSIDDLASLPGQTVPWTGVRNYQARNFMRDDMREGDGVLFYASNADPSGVTGQEYDIVSRLGRGGDRAREHDQRQRRR